MTTNITAQRGNRDLATGQVTSGDGTRIAYLRLGNGPGLVLLHGSMETARSHLQLACELADRFTVYLPDRRGRGMSGPYGPDYSISREVEDLAALLAESGAGKVFGVSAGGLVALEAARTLPNVRMVALYEPALTESPELSSWLARFDREMSEGKVSAAMVTSMKGLKAGPPILNVMPSRLLTSLTNLALKSEDKKAGPADVTMRMLAPTIYYEGRLIAEMTGTVDSFAAVDAQVLLLGGSKGLAWIKPGLDALNRVLPNVQRVELPGLDHGGSGDVTSRNRGGKPEVVAAELRTFFAQP